MRIETLKHSNRFFLSDGGLETFMIFEKGFDLPCFSAAVLLDTPEGRMALTAYVEQYIDLARQTNRGFVMDTPTWRAGAAWAEPMGLSLSKTLEINQRAADFMRSIRNRQETDRLPILLNGVVGPSGDAYAPDAMVTVKDSLLLHTPQIHALGRAGVDMLSAMTLTHAGEAAGIAIAAHEIDLPVVISFTLETDGRLPSGQTLGEAIAEVDEETNAAPLYYMINCAHPDHFRHILDTSAAWIRRIGGIRTNASRMSHAELDKSQSLDDGNPIELGHLNADLLTLLPNIRVIGGCCGTDHRHVGCIAKQETLHSVACH